MDTSYEKNHLSQIRPYLAECCVFLKRDESFPLKEPCRVACYGSGVVNTIKGGTGSGEVNSRYFVNIEEGLKEAGFTIINPDWHNQYLVFLEKAKEDFKKEIKEHAKKIKSNVLVASMGKVLKEPEYNIDLDFSADAAIYVLSRISGEGNDRVNEKGDFQLTSSETRDILSLHRGYKKFILLINTGGPVDLTPVMEVGNILYISQLGVETGHVVADILLGKENPSGKLATTWAAYENYGHMGDFGQKDDTHYKEGIYVGYRYFDAVKEKPLFSFGYGLSYTNFSLGNVEVKKDKEKIGVKVEVKNEGGYPGKEVVQVYVGKPFGKLDKEVKSLAGFKKTKLLDPNESESVEVEMNLLDCSSYDPEREAYVLEKGKYTILVGNSSDHVTPIQQYELKEDIIIKKVKNLFGDVDFKDWANTEEVKYEGIPCEEIDLSHIQMEVVDYDTEEEIDEKFHYLTDDQLSRMNIGAFNPKGGILSIIGNAATHVAGAAGESTSTLKEEGIENIIMADGPAGLRLAKEYYVDDKGVHSVKGMIPESMVEMLPKVAQWFFNRKPKPKKGRTFHTQYTTSLPIATAVANSWNLEFAKECGDVVGKEMEIFGIDLWLAPALNIHRDVLCGRNFEYYSEDPYLSGVFAGYVTLGVQAHNKGTTIKHFAANNQETNRYANNSCVSERALREIYLRGFQKCIEISRPYALMTSYNLINGEHTSESYALTTSLLRKEWGYKGVVMTDWVIGGAFLSRNAKYPEPDAGKVAKAGCSLFMPGSKKNYEEVLNGLNKGIVSRKQLMINATYLYRTIQKLRNKE